MLNFTKNLNKVLSLSLVFLFFVSNVSHADALRIPMIGVKRVAEAFHPPVDQKLTETSSIKYLIKLLPNFCRNQVSNAINELKVVQTVGDLITKVHMSEMLSGTNVGQKTVAEIESILAKEGLPGIGSKLPVKSYSPVKYLKLKKETIEAINRTPGLRNISVGELSRVPNEVLTGKRFHLSGEMVNEIREELTRYGFSEGSSIQARDVITEVKYFEGGSAVDPREYRYVTDESGDVDLSKICQASNRTIWFERGQDGRFKPPMTGELPIDSIASASKQKFKGIDVVAIELEKILANIKRPIVFSINKRTGTVSWALKQDIENPHPKEFIWKTIGNISREGQNFRDSFLMTRKGGLGQMIIMPGVSIKQIEEGLMAYLEGWSKTQIVVKPKDFSKKSLTDSGTRAILSTTI